ncbi:hypothetical protein P9246_16000 [Aeribacillus pallidus]|uniref:Uncharacterized protein n=1 Tax=Aeribacillus pallidus TaxID=33936 RepID=A0A165Z6A1_9BACI|nr:MULTISPECIES: hypothetical protein [Aeribacillus]KZM53023.1 hypothetical protein A3Q35_03260 [Aeribacillus pallidus]KZN97898.1 hypothetical protein AZI98_00815 [Aeribacillus pallidus]MED0652323.1 hypothetical protein [Aeribacillus composti]MED4488223.1 hypothetical protein [Aeribacillus pallidus]
MRFRTDYVTFLILYSQDELQPYFCLPKKNTFRGGSNNPFDYGFKRSANFAAKHKQNLIGCFQAF